MATKIAFQNYSLTIGTDQVLRGVTLDIAANQVTAVFGPAGGGKSGLLRSINRMAELTPNTHHAGDILLDGRSIFAADVDPVALRRKVAMVFAQPIPLPMSIYDNVVYGLRLQQTRDTRQLDAAVERGLRGAALWEEVQNRLNSSALALSGGQQQRLGIARALALSPDVLLLDTPTAALDPISTAKIEDLLAELSKNLTIVIVPHSVQQATRVADDAAFFMSGVCIESGPARQIFMAPRNQQTENYVTGRFG